MKTHRSLLKNIQTCLELDKELLTFVRRNTGARIFNVQNNIVRSTSLLDDLRPQFDVPMLDKFGSIGCVKKR